MTFFCYKTVLIFWVQEKEYHRLIHSEEDLVVFICRDCGDQFASCEGVFCHQVLFAKCRKRPSLRKPKSLRDRQVQEKIEDIVIADRMIYKAPQNANIFVQTCLMTQKYG